MCFQDGMVDEEVGDDPKAMQFAKMDVPEIYMATNDEELIKKLEQVGMHAVDAIGTKKKPNNFSRRDISQQEHTNKIRAKQSEALADGTPFAFEL